MLEVTQGNEKDGSLPTENSEAPSQKGDFKPWATTGDQLIVNCGYPDFDMLPGIGHRWAEPTLRSLNP